ncbi:unnamed protein product [Brassica napus]|uniref:(rape) hypothetical protein n=1 Tax=Brassica napus TaxID=3708 RepID=A0A816YIW7_BRANA|nr:unnamed protein product [Brassica napus]
MWLRHVCTKQLEGLDHKSFLFLLVKPTRFKLLTFLMDLFNASREREREGWVGVFLLREDRSLFPVHMKKRKGKSFFKKIWAVNETQKPCLWEYSSGLAINHLTLEWSGLCSGGKGCPNR